MNKLILSQSNDLTMSSLEIALYTKKDHPKVLLNIRAMLSELEVNQSDFGQVYLAGNGQEQPMFVLNRKLTDCLLTGYSAKARMAVIERWHELEGGQHKLPQSFGEALQLAADQARQLELAAPKVAFVDRFVESTGNKTFREVAKILKANEREFRAFLYGQEIMYQLGGGWTAYAKHIDAGRFYVTAGEANSHAYVSCKFTPKGIEWVAGKWIVYTEVV